MIHMQICVISFDVLQMLPFYLLMESHQESISNCRPGVLGKGSFLGHFVKEKIHSLGNIGLKVKVGTIKGWRTLGAFSIIHLSKFPAPAVTPTFLPLHLLSCKCQNFKNICPNFETYLSWSFKCIRFQGPP